MGAEYFSHMTWLLIASLHRSACHLFQNTQLCVCVRVNIYTIVCCTHHSAYLGPDESYLLDLTFAGEEPMA